MYSILTVIALVASLASADDLPVPRSMCSSPGVDATYGPIMCAIGDAPKQANTPNVAFTDQNCTPAFCSGGTMVEVCKGSKPPGAVAWSDISKAIETAYTGCSGVSRNPDNSIRFPRGDGWQEQVPFKAFSYIADGWQVNVKGGDCSAPGNSNVAKWKCSTS